MGGKSSVYTPPASPLAIRVPAGVLGSLYDLSSLVLSELDSRRKLEAILETITEQMSVERCAVIFLNRNGNGGPGGTRFSPGSDDLYASEYHPGEFTCALQNYPELKRQFERGLAHVLETAGGNGVSGRSTAARKKKRPAPMMTVPIHLDGRIIGVLFIRVSSARKNFAPWESDFCSVLANFAASSLIR